MYISRASGVRMALLTDTGDVVEAIVIVVLIGVTAHCLYKYSTGSGVKAEPERSHSRLAHRTGKAAQPFILYYVASECGMLPNTASCHRTGLGYRPH